MTAATSAGIRNPRGAAPTVVSSHERVAVTSLLLSVHVFLCLLERNVHVSVHGLELSWIRYVSIQARQPCSLFRNPGRYGIQDLRSSYTPLYTTPEFSFTVTGLPMISLKKPDGSPPWAWVVVPFSIVFRPVPVRSIDILCRSARGW
jgi:hypothetical protein